MHKKVITIIMVIIMLILVGVTFTYFNKSSSMQSYNESDNSGNLATENNTLDEEARNKLIEDGKKYKNPEFGDIITVRISNEQIIPMHTPVIIQDEIYKNFEYIVDNAYATRKLPDEYEAKASTRNIYGDDTIAEDGTILKDWYYVVVDIGVKNAGEKDNILIPNNTEVIFIDKDGMATDDTKVHKNAITYRETSDVKRFNELRYIPDFKPGETARYQQIFLVRDSEVERDCVYIRATYGTRGERLLADSNQRYIKLNLEVQ